MDYKETLNMPKTDFEMKGNLNKKDPLFIKSWAEKEIYNELSSRNSLEFILHDGPPYANGDIHAGHALNKILKDILIRNEALNNKKIFWELGWDTHGLPIELKVQQSGIKLSEVGRKKYLEECEKYALSQVEKQQSQFKKLALLTDFKKKYLTLDSNFIFNQLTVFNKMLNKKLVYQDLKPVYWSWSSETALAEAEIEYKNVVDDSIFVEFKHENLDFSFVIWTTTPWTLTGNVAIAFGKDIDYSIVECENKKLILATKLIDNLSKTIKKEIKIIKRIDIKKYIGQCAINPINNRKSRLVWGHHVTIEGGTGLVHIAGGHGNDDFLIVKENNLELIVVLNDKGIMINSKEFNDFFYLKANKLIIEKLEKLNCLLFKIKFSHSVPIDWRTKKPIVYRATKQWFVSINKIKSDLFSEIKKINWFPKWGEKKLIDMTQNRSDWCISRQRVWGVPIPIIYDENNEVIFDNELQENIANLIKNKGIFAWYDAKIEDVLPKKIKYSKGMKKETDILDVWFDSGTSYETLNNKIADVYLEGNDQYRGWFNSSLINSYVSKNRAPYKNVITHGFTIDEKGNKMSKSIGNTIDPLKIIDKYGVDILRMWVASSDYQDNIRISNEIIKYVSNDYRKIRNTIKFLIGNLYDFSEGDFDIKKMSLTLISKSILDDIRISFEKISIKYSEYNFSQVVKILLNQLNSGSIKYILDYYKEIGYTTLKNDYRRRELQYVLNNVLKFILFSIAPIIPVTVEEAWEKIDKKNTLFFEQTYPTFDKFSEGNFKDFSKIKDMVNKSLEKLRENKIISKSNEATIDLFLTKDFEIWKNELNNKNLFVAKLNIIIADELMVVSKKFNGIKCARCWNYFHENEMNGDICKDNCKMVIEKLI